MPGIARMLKPLGRVRYTYIQIVPPYTKMFVVGHKTFFFFFVPLIHPLMHNQHFSLKPFREGNYNVVFDPS